MGYELHARSFAIERDITPTMVTRWNYEDEEMPRQTRLTNRHVLMGRKIGEEKERRQLCIALTILFLIAMMLIVSIGIFCARKWNETPVQSPCKPKQPASLYRDPLYKLQEPVDNMTQPVKQKKESYDYEIKKSSPYVDNGVDFFVATSLLRFLRF